MLWEWELIDPEVTYTSKIIKDETNYEVKVEYSIILAEYNDFLK